MKNLRTRILSLLLCALMLVPALASCAEEETTAPRVMALVGPTGMGMAKLISDDNYDVSLETAPDKVKAAIVEGSVDIAAVPVNLAAALYNATNGGVKLFAVNTLGVLYTLENGETVNSVADLKGKTIAATGQGSTPEYIIRYVLSKNGIDPDNDVTINWYTENTVLLADMVAGKVDLSIVPEPLATTITVKSEGKARVALNMTEEWGKVDENQLIQGVMIVRSEYYEANKSEVEDFMAEYKASVEWVKTNEAAPALLAELGIVAAEGIAKNALPRCNITFIDGDMKAVTEPFYKVLFDANPKSVGGKMPADDFYLNIEAK